MKKSSKLRKSVIIRSPLGLSLGMSLVFYGFWLNALAMLLLMSVGLGRGSSLTVMNLVLGCASILFLTAATITLLGQCLCLMPRKRNAGKRSSLSCRRAPSVGNPNQLGGFPWKAKIRKQLDKCSFRRRICLLSLVLRQLGLFMQNSDLAGKASRLLAIGAVLVAILVIMALVPAAGQIGILVLPMALLGLVLALTGLILYSRLLQGFQKALARASRTRADARPTPDVMCRLSLVGGGRTPRASTRSEPSLSRSGTETFGSGSGTAKRSRFRSRGCRMRIGNL